MARPRSGIWLSLLASAALLSVAGCKTAETLNPSSRITQGYVIDEEALEMVPPGSSREQVLLALGTPSTTATFDNEAYYYISQTRVRPVAFMNPRIVDQRIMAVYFDEEGQVTNIAQYGMQDGRVIDFLSQTTPTGGREQSFLGQMLSGLAGGSPPVNLPGR